MGIRLERKRFLSPDYSIQDGIHTQALYSFFSALEKRDF